jgi:hypothetical protein
MKKYKLEILGLITGAIAGWWYWYFVGCASGTCPITSNPYISVVYGAVMGGLAFSIFKKQPEKTKE